MDQNFPPPLPLPADYLDPLELLKSKSEDELYRLADEYFSKIEDYEFLLSKPFVWTGGVPTLLGDFAALIHAAEIYAGVRILDFAAGSCWTSRYLAQMGGNVVATDVSETALKIGAELLERSPIRGKFGQLRFGKLDNILYSEEYQEYFDRVVIMDAFHHLPNYQSALSDLFRLLAPGGILVMSEPGRWHSRTSAAQSEIQFHQVLERDFDIYEVSEIALRVGFERIESGVFSPIPAFFPYENHNEVLLKNESFLAAQVRNHMTNHSLLRMFKPGSEEKDSRRGEGLLAEIKYENQNRSLSITNTGKVKWLASGEYVGSVNIGFTRVGKNGNLGAKGEWRIPLSSHDILPGDSTTIFLDEALYSDLPEIFEVDLYSTQIAWFKSLGSKALTVEKRLI